MMIYIRIDENNRILVLDFSGNVDNMFPVQTELTVEELIVNIKDYIYENNGLTYSPIQ